MKNPYDVIKYPLNTEKAVRDMEANNALIFIVNDNSTKAEIRWAVEKAFNVKVVNVRTLNTMKGHKKAYIKLSEETPAIDVTSQLGLL